MLASRQGQASLEYLLVGIVLMIVIVALAAVWRFASQGQMAQLLQQGASHVLETLGGVADVFLY